MKEEEPKHWADKYADEIVKRKQKEEYIVESGITPSGIVHVGNFREILTQEFVYKALLDKGVKAIYQYFWDDYDRFRKVPIGVPSEWEKYIGIPISKTPDPWGCHDSYAEHFQEPVIREMQELVIEVSFKHASKEYPAGTFVEMVKKALENTSLIKNILDKYRAEPLEEGWLPVRVYCEECGKDTTKAKYLGNYELEYECVCGHKAVLDFSKKPGNAKLPWRVDWPMRWAFYDVDFESSGKDHKAAGGSWDTGVLIARQVFEHEPPIGPMYEFVNVKGQKEKMSSSKGNVVTVTELLRVYEPEVVRYLYTAKINKAFDISFDADLLNTYNYFDEARKKYYSVENSADENEARRYFFSRIGEHGYVELPQFSVCVNAIQIALGDVEKAKKILKKTGHAYEHADERLKLAWNWVQDYAPEQFKFTVKEEMPDVMLSEWGEEVKELLRDTADFIETGTRAGDEIQQFIYNKAKEKEIPLKTAFMVFYQLLLGKSRGPRLGPFLASLDKEFVVKRLRLEE